MHFVEYDLEAVLATLLYIIMTFGVIMLVTNVSLVEINWKGGW